MSGSNYAHCDVEPCLMPDGSTKVLYIGDDDIPATTVIRHGVCDVARLAAIEAALLARLTEVEGERDGFKSLLAETEERAESWCRQAYDLGANLVRLRQQLDRLTTQLAEKCDHQAFEDLKGERDAMRPVVEAAKAWRAQFADEIGDWGPTSRGASLVAAVDSYLKGSLAGLSSPESDERPSDDAVATDGVGEQGEALGAARVFRSGDPEPDDVERVRDVHGEWQKVGHYWQLVERADSDDELRVWPALARKYGPLTEVRDEADPKPPTETDQPADPPWLEEAIEAAERARLQHSTGTFGGISGFGWNCACGASGDGSAMDHFMAVAIRAALPLIAQGVLGEAALDLAARADRWAAKGLRDEARMIRYASAVVRVHHARRAARQVTS